jgi:hypothetical protein
MIKRSLVAILLVSLLAPSLFAAELNPADQAYVNQLNYRHNKLELTTKTRTVNEISSYSSTDINSSNYRFNDNYRESNANITTSTLNRAEQKELTDWYIYKGGVDTLSDLEFLRLVGDTAMFNAVDEKVDARRVWTRTGYITIGLGLVAMIGGAALQASQPVILGGALVTTVGFFISAFSERPSHYIKSSYALNKIDEYNIKLKQQLGLPLSFE